MNPTVTLLDPADKALILQIAHWYFREWNTPVDKTLQLLSTYPNEVVLFHSVLTIDGVLVATGGIRRQVNILNVHKHLRQFGPWLALLYTKKAYRGRGFGGLLLEEIEGLAKQEGLSKIYLYTFTAESLYKRCGWKKMTTLPYKGHDTVVMEKEL